MVGGEDSVALSLPLLRPIWPIACCASREGGSSATVSELSTAKERDVKLAPYFTTSAGQYPDDISRTRSTSTRAQPTTLRPPLHSPQRASVVVVRGDAVRRKHCCFICHFFLAAAGGAGPSSPGPAQEGAEAVGPGDPAVEHDRGGGQCI